MTNEAVIQALNMAIAEVGWNYPLDYALAFGEAIKAVEKQMPKRLKGLKRFKNAAKGYGMNSDVLTGACPMCGRTLTKDYADIWHCPICGQGLDWSEDNA